MFYRTPKYRANVSTKVSALGSKYYLAKHLTSPPQPPVRKNANEDINFRLDDILVSSDNVLLNILVSLKQSLYLVTRISSVEISESYFEWRGKHCE